MVIRMSSVESGAARREAARKRAPSVEPRKLSQEERDARRGVWRPADYETDAKKRGNPLDIAFK